MIKFIIIKLANLIQFTSNLQNKRCNIFNQFKFPIIEILYIKSLYICIRTFLELENK